ncbi:NAD(P)(+)--arginine ADP-ribosyltransferase 2-like [Hirundo rustica]|uniref:NAD(P)(+)--arginine ADP-ribosyltransferase 2-like n=1 Tax=Hirundo rustica TaxID=43150 RepID=UPI001A951239|nr:NAD(P)(+)--arginine ADP-ribosyltransferase 2-like [Hirundo rustica]XP_058280236.1 NAD(P)(+)--arginine ADP-ribosyltransferase 2-like [Hirundo rustica]
MAPLARTLALLAMAMATVAIKELPLDMAPNSFDDQYLKCTDTMPENLLDLQLSDFCGNKMFAKNWMKAEADWVVEGSIPHSLTPDEAIALWAYTMKELHLYKQFNEAVCVAGSSKWKYRNEFHFKSLHFLLTQALQKLRNPNQCYDVFRGVKNTRFKVKKNDKVRFGQFASSSMSEDVAQDFGQDTLFKVHTCHGVDIQEFSKYPEEEEVLIPPFEIFSVTDVRKEGNTMVIELHSTGNGSNYDCEWLNGGSLPRNSPHLGVLLLATVAMAVVTGTL